MLGDFVFIAGAHVKEQIMFSRLRCWWTPILCAGPVCFPLKSTNCIPSPWNHQITDRTSCIAQAHSFEDSSRRQNEQKQQMNKVLDQWVVLSILIFWIRCQKFRNYCLKFFVVKGEHCIASGYLFCLTFPQRKLYRNTQQSEFLVLVVDRQKGKQKHIIITKPRNVCEEKDILPTDSSSLKPCCEYKNRENYILESGQYENDVCVILP